MMKTATCLHAHFLIISQLNSKSFAETLERSMENANSNDDASTNALTVKSSAATKSLSHWESIKRQLRLKYET